MTEPSFTQGFLTAALLFFGLVVSLVPRRRSRRWKPRSLPVPPAAWSLESLLSLLQLTTFDRLSPAAQQSVVERLRAADRGPLSMREHGRVNLILGEIALSSNDREEARQRFRAALRWDPSLRIRRVLERLEAPTPLSFTSRRAA
jgi:hypothetical protein